MSELIDRDKVWALFVDHYWDSVQANRDLILCHIDAVLRMTPPAAAGEATTEPVTSHDIYAEADKLRADNERLRTALKPFADAVYNDNGDMTITPASLDAYRKHAYPVDTCSTFL